MIIWIIWLFGLNKTCGSQWIRALFNKCSFVAQSGLHGIEDSGWQPSDYGTFWAVWSGSLAQGPNTGPWSFTVSLSSLARKACSSSDTMRKFPPCRTSKVLRPTGHLSLQCGSLTILKHTNPQHSMKVGSELLLTVKRNHGSTLISQTSFWQQWFWVLQNRGCLSKQSNQGLVSTPLSVEPWLTSTHPYVFQVLSSTKSLLVLSFSQ